MLVIAAPAIGFFVLLGVFPFAWALITRFLLLLSRLRVISNTDKVCGPVIKVVSLLIVIVYIGAGVVFWWI